MVVGASAAGLAVAASLKTRGIDAVLLEQHEHVGHAWSNHYQRLHLHTSRGLSGLPGFPMPKSYPLYPSRQQVVDHLEAYREHFDLHPRYGQTVMSVRREGDLWLVETTMDVFRAFFFSDDGWEPPHVHVEPGGGVLKYWSQLDEDLSVRWLLFPHPEDAQRVGA